MIHGDLNEQNVIVRRRDFQSSSSADNFGVIDFGDSERGPYVFDVAIAAVYCMLQSRIVDPLDVCGHLLAGYLSRSHQRTLTAAERAALWPCVTARLAQSLTMSAYTHSVDPTNDYVLKSATRGWTLLRRIREDTSPEQLKARLHTVLASYGYTD